MLRRLPIALLLTATLGCARGPATDGAKTEAGASLQVVGHAPITVRGQGFRPREKVRVSAGGRQWRLQVGVTGSFVLELRGADSCRIVRIVAVGSAGRRAILRIMPSGQCAGASTP